MTRDARLLVTGATGFLGRSLVPLLRSRGCEVAALGRDEEPGAAARIVSGIVEFEPTAVVHLATRFIAVHEPTDIPDLVRSNVEFGALVAEGSARAGARLVSTGTAWQHFAGHDYDPVSLYAATKQALSTIVDYYVAVQGLEACEVTIFDTYGPADPRPKPIPSLMRAALDGRTLQMSDGHQLVDLTYVDDVVAGIADVALGADLADRCVLRSWSPITIRSLVAAVEEAIERPVPVEWGVRTARPREMRDDWVFGESPVGWAPAIPLAEGLRRTWAAFVEAGPGRMSDDRPLVSIVIPVYNGMPFVVDAVGSALAQGYEPLEVVVIENHSSDGTAEWLRTQSDPRLRVVYRDETQPAGANWNQAIGESTGAHVKLMCADDLIVPEAVERQVAAMQASPGTVMAAARRRVIDAQGEVLKATHGLGPLRGVVDRTAAVRACCLAGTNLLGEPAAILFDGDAIRGAMPWRDELPYVIDLSTYVSVLAHGDLVCLPDVLASFRVSATSWSSELVSQQADQVRRWRDGVLAEGIVHLSRTERVRSDASLRLRAAGRRVYFKRVARAARRAQ